MPMQIKVTKCAAQVSTLACSIRRPPLVERGSRAWETQLQTLSDSFQKGFHGPRICRRHPTPRLIFV